MVPRSRANVVHVIGDEGSEQREQIASLIVNLSRRRFEVAVVGPLSRPLRDELTRYGVRWANVPIPLEATTIERTRCVAQLQRVFADREAHIVHAHSLTAGSVAALAAHRLRPRPATVVSAQGLMPAPPAGALERLRWRRTLGRTLALADRVIAESQAHLRLLHEAAGHAAREALVIPPGLDQGRYSHKTDAGVKRRQLGLIGEAALVGAVGTLQPGQGFEKFLRAAALIIEDLPNVEFLVLGEGPLRPSLEALAHELRITGSTVFMGDRNDIPEIISAMNVLVAPSPGAGGALRALQGLSLKIPVVGVEGGTVCEMLAGLEEVVCTRPDDAETLAAGIREHLEILPAPGQRPTATSAVGLTLAHEDFLVSKEEYDLDRAGLRRRTQETGERSDVDRALQRYDIGEAAKQLAEVYEGLLDDRP